MKLKPLVKLFSVDVFSLPQSLDHCRGVGLAVDAEARPSARASPRKRRIAVQLKSKELCTRNRVAKELQRGSMDAMHIGVNNGSEL